MGRVLLIALVLAGCGGSSTSATPEPPRFDLAAVKANFTDECESPAVVDELFCEQVQIDGMTAEGTILNVPTLLNAAAQDRAVSICEQLAEAHFDAAGKDLGYTVIGVDDQDGGDAAACMV